MITNTPTPLMSGDHMQTAVNMPEEETPEKVLPVVDMHDDMKALIKVLSNINKELHNINKNLSRR